jgi:hypothetical protein
MDITSDEFYQFAGTDKFDPGYFKIDAAIGGQLSRLRDAIVNLAPYELLCPPSDIAPQDRQICNILECCFEHQRSYQDRSLLHELAWRLVSVHSSDPVKIEFAKLKAKELHSERRRVVGQFYQAIFETFSRHPFGDRIDIVDATALQETNGMNAWSSTLKEFLESNGALASGGVRIKRILLAGAADSLDVNNPNIISQFEAYSAPATGGRLQGKIIKPNQSDVLAGLNPHSHIQQFTKPHQIAVDTVVRRIRRLRMENGFADLPAFHGLINEPSKGYTLRGLLKTSLNHTLFGGVFVVHLNQYFWVTRAVSSPVVLGDVILWNRSLERARGFSINNLSTDGTSL